MPIQALLSALLAMLAVGGFGFVFVYPLLSGERQAEKRQAILSTGTRRQPEKQADGATRRRQIAESLKEIERRNTRKRVSLETKIGRAGLRISKRTFFIYSAISGLLLGFLFYVLTHKLYLAGAAAVVGAVGLPTWSNTTEPVHNMADLVYPVCCAAGSSPALESARSLLYHGQAF